MDDDYRYIPLTDNTPNPHIFRVVIEPEGIRIIVAEGETKPDEQEVLKPPHISVTLG
jgi:hypothetical protein